MGSVSLLDAELANADSCDDAGSNSKAVSSVYGQCPREELHQNGRAFAIDCMLKAIADRPVHQRPTKRAQLAAFLRRCAPKLRAYILCPQSACDMLARTEGFVARATTSEVLLQGKQQFEKRLHVLMMEHGSELLQQMAALPAGSFEKLPSDWLSTMNVFCEDFQKWLAGCPPSMELDVEPLMELAQNQFSEELKDFQAQAQAHDLLHCLKEVLVASNVHA